MEIVMQDETATLKSEQLIMIEELLEVAAKELAITEEAELSVTFMTNEKIHTFNKEYRDVDSATDVISFAIEDEMAEDLPIHFPADFEMPRQLGDILISVDRTSEQAKSYGHSFDRELGFLAVHGFLHLNGYDHQTESEEKEMFDLQRKILAVYGLER